MYQRRYHKKGNRWRIEASKKNTSLLILTLRIHQKTLQTKYFATSDSVIKTLPEINTSFLLKLEPNIHQPLRKSRMSERWVINTTTASLCYFVVQISVCWHKQTSATTGSSSSSSAIFFFHTSLSMRIHYSLTRVRHSRSRIPWNVIAEPMSQSEKFGASFVF